MWQKGKVSNSATFGHQLTYMITIRDSVVVDCTLEFFWGVPVPLLAKGLWSSPLLNNMYRYLIGPLRCTITSLGFTNGSLPLQFGTKSLKSCRGEELIINHWLAKYYGHYCIIIYIFRALIFLKEWPCQWCLRREEEHASTVINLY